MRVLIVGAAGGIGLRLAKLLTDRGDHVLGLHRRPEQSSGIAATGSTPVLGDVVSDTDVRIVELAFGCDVIIFTAGAHGSGRDQTAAIDGRGVERFAAAAEIAGVTRFVLVSAFPESERRRTLGADFEHYLAVKKASELYLSRTNLDWLIVRPGNLLDTPGRGTVDAGPAALDRDVTRDDVASFIAAAVHTAAVTRMIVEISAGATPITEAVDSLIGAVGPRFGA